MFAHIENTYFSEKWWASLDQRIQSHIEALALEGNPYYAEWSYISERFMPWEVTGVTESYGAA